MESLAEQIEKLDNVAHTLQIPLPAEVHVSCLKKILPEVVAALKGIYAKQTGENPWA